MSGSFFDEVLHQTDALRATAAKTADDLRGFSRRLELILSQDHKKISVRDTGFVMDFSSFCTALRQDMDQKMDYWQQDRTQLRKGTDKEGYEKSLAIKSFVNRSKTLSRAADELTTAYAQFMRLYKNYTLSKLPVWLLTSCCEDLNNLTGKILFLAREQTKKTEKQKGVEYGG